MNVEAIIKLKNLGEMKFKLFLDTPNSTSNFVSLAESGYYDGLNFHRVIPGFVAQGGCPDGSGMGGPGYTIDGEFKSNGFDNPHPHKKGVLSWARSQARNSAGSQFFLTIGDANFLDGDYAVFGEIVEGEEFLDKFESIGTPGGNPIENIVIETIIINKNGLDVPELIKVK